nr:hypothetical protein [Tanacetum cinerariifolium]
IPSKLETFTSNISNLSSQVAKLKNIQWELPVEFLDLPHLAYSVQEKLNTLDSLLGADISGSALAVKSAKASCLDVDSECKIKEVDQAVKEEYLGALESTGTSRLQMAFM